MRRKFLVTLSIKRKLNKLARAIGVQLNWKRDPIKSYQWDGKDIACKNQDVSNILHDIAHYLICPVKFRKELDFGLGTGPDSKIESECLNFNSPEEEVKASALGIWWEKQLGLPWQSTAILHSWNDKFIGLSSNFPDLHLIWDSKAFKNKAKKYEILFRSGSKGSAIS